MSERAGGMPHGFGPIISWGGIGGAESTGAIVREKNAKAIEVGWRCIAAIGDGLICLRSGCFICRELMFFAHGVSVSHMQSFGEIRCLAWLSTVLSTVS